MKILEDTRVVEVDITLNLRKTNNSDERAELEKAEDTIG